ncbi:MAG: sigma-E factor negative regulatory protein RseC [Candidatus Saganbacteria bacterium]|uniref:Sigma-E factor negative regulatory protein RseC n=1 Tax=Candidatus Saganbacteria bacterium TaxID=2575572 RepID=A0A833NXZ7_UNCSA|nr:MAG: sigma-E factor negative regulatory protein RseC [Candidatus Saganbacteria bacterium]
MIELGIVKNILPGNLATVTFKSHGACKNCGMCLVAGNEASIKAKNEIGAKVGDKVKVEISPKEVIRAAGILFILPILSMIAGYFIGGIIFSFVFLFASFILIYLFEKAIKKDYVSCKMIERIVV